MRAGSLPSPRAGLAAVLLFAVALPARAQQIPVIRIVAQGTPLDEGVPAVHRVAAALGPDALTGTALATALAENYGSAPLAGDALARARETVASSITAYTHALQTGNTADLAQALATLDAALREFEAQPEAMDSNADNRRAVRRGLLTLAEQAVTAGSPTRAEDAMRRLARIDAAAVFTAREASPEVQHDYTEAVAALPQGSLAVDSVPSGCRVFRDGRAAGTAPVELENLVPGEHRIAVQCGAVRSLVHRVDVAAQTRATLIIDAQLDAAIVTGAEPMLRYPTLDRGEARLVADLAALGRALSARRMYALIVREDRVRVIDVATASVIGESPVTDGARLRFLATQSNGDGTPASSPEPSTASPVPATVASAAPSPSPTASAPTIATTSHPATVTHTSGGIPATAIVLGIVGVLAVGAGWYVAVRADGDVNRAYQTGANASDTPQTRVDALAEASTLRWVELGCLAGGGVALLSAVLIGAFGRSETTVQSAMLVPTTGGAVVGVTGRF